MSCVKNRYMLCCWCLDHIRKKVKYDKTEESHPKKQGRKHRKKKKKWKSSSKYSESVKASNVKSQASSSDIPRLPRSPAEISANWKQLIQVSNIVYDVLITTCMIPTVLSILLIVGSKDATFEFFSIIDNRLCINRFIFIMKIVHEVQETKKKCKKVQSASMCSS